MDTVALKSQFHTAQVTLTNNPQSKHTTAEIPGSEPPAYSLFADALQSHQTLLKAQESESLVENQDDPALGFVTSLWKSESGSTRQGVSSATRFVHALLNPATQAAKRLGTDAAAVISVAALETGWGQHVIDTPTGQSSHNLFGIKATSPGSANSVNALTTEFTDGEAATSLEAFRTYGSTTESVADFANFILDNPRYSQALQHADDPRAFIEQIHLAGYATDPDYADKVKSVLQQVEAILENPQNLALDQVVPFPISR